MKLFVAILLLTFSFGCKSQSKPEKTQTEKPTELKPPFSNQGEQEDYWTQEFFKDKYEKQIHGKFTDKIEILNEKELLDGHGKFIEFVNEIQFGNRTVNIHLPDLKYQPIFKTGILYPELISESNFDIGAFEELNFLSHSVNVKRFRMWIFYEKRANPEVYLFELTNNKAMGKTNFAEFIENAELTFIKNGWIII
ncbi:hypothetical protein [Winogradskyella psychrotolerans]|uniref:hypothetical protein n=1 Tax=Winogradskyella psychrotolerans TaxID=1344585 RepID=UPI001C069A8B|nr:hypothetical protein [Winogradskyella psychrotolerans]MBU2929621.1 hypothetical protein [Winogradskyella psychrotolerans]